MDDDPIAPARGVIHGILIGMLLWACIFGAWAFADAVREARTTECPDVCEAQP